MVPIANTTPIPILFHPSPDSFSLFLEGLIFKNDRRKKKRKNFSYHFKSFVPHLMQNFELVKTFAPHLAQYF